MGKRYEGRHTKLTAPVRNSLVDSIRVGLTKTLAASRAGIGISTLMLWLADGRKHRRLGYRPLKFDRKTNTWADRSTQRDSSVLELLEAIERAEADMITEAMVDIRTSAKGGSVVKRTTRTTRGEDGSPQTVVTEEVASPDWRASAWLVERTRPADYGSHTRDQKVGQEVEQLDGELVPGDRSLEERVVNLLQTVVGNAEALGTADAAVAALRSLESAAHATKAAREMGRKPVEAEFDEGRLTDEELQTFNGLMERMRVKKVLTAG